jgi:hypothetical protein
MQFNLMSGNLNKRISYDNCWVYTGNYRLPKVYVGKQKRIRGGKEG